MELQIRSELVKGGQKGNIQTSATVLRLSITHLILSTACPHLLRFIIFAASSASWRAFLGDDISTWPLSVGGAGTTLSMGRKSIEGERGLEAEAAVASENSAVCWATEGAVAASVGRLSTLVVVKVVELGLAEKAIDK